MDKTEAVKLLLAEDGGMTHAAVAEALKERFGLEVKPGIVAVIRSSFRWQEVVAAAMADSARLAAEIASRPQEKKPMGRRKKAAGDPEASSAAQPPADGQPTA